MISTDLGRAVAFAWITVVVATEQMTLMILYLSVFAVGVLETIFDTASMSITPSLVQRDQLERANARIGGALIAFNEFVGPLLGAALFVDCGRSAFWRQRCHLRVERGDTAHGRRALSTRTDQTAFSHR